MWWSWLLSNRKSHKDLTVCIYIFTHSFSGVLVNLAVFAVEMWTEHLQEQGGGPSRSEFGLLVGQGGEVWIAAAYTKFDLRLTRQLQFPLVLSQRLYEQK